MTTLTSPHFPTSPLSSKNIARSLAACLVAPAVFSGALLSVERRPNIVYIFSDQHSSDMLGCYGNQDIITPNLDKMAAEGVRFRHCVSNSPLCTPYRGILLSGQHPLNNGAFSNDLQMLPGRGNYFGEVLRDGGYHTGYYGKWHLYGGDRERGIPSGPYRYGFDNEFLSNNCTLVYDAARAYYWSQDGRDKKLYGDWEPYAQTRQAMSFIDNHADKPFALFISWHAPHNWSMKQGGYDAPPDLLALYDPAKLHLRPTVKDMPRVREMYQGQMAMITGLDRCVGMLFEKLKQRGLLENTIVVFTSDHGDLLMSYDWKDYKSRAETGSSRVPLLIHWSARLKPAVSDLLVGSLDLMPTLLGMLGLPVPKTCQGRNASNAIITGCNNDGVDIQPLFMFPRDWRGVYTRRYTYSETVRQPNKQGVNSGEIFNILYDRQEDPDETHNLFHASEAAEIRRCLHEKTLEQMARFGDTGLTCDEILRRTVTSECMALLKKADSKRPRGWEGILKGRPIDMISKQSEPSIKKPESK